MINEIKKDAEKRMGKSLDALHSAFAKIRTGRAHPNLLDSIYVEYYGAKTPLNQMANIVVEDARTLSVTTWDIKMGPEVERAILKSDLGLNPNSAGSVIRIPMPALTEETRKGFMKQAKHEAENSRVSIRSIRRDANAHLKELMKDKEIGEDEEHGALEAIQKLTDRFIAEVEKNLQVKEADLMEI